MLKSFVIKASEGFSLAHADRKQGHVEVSSDADIILFPSGETMISLKKLDRDGFHGYNVFERHGYWLITTCYYSGDEREDILNLENEYISLGGDTLQKQASYVNGFKQKN